MPSFRTHGKTYLAALFFFITAIQAFISDNHITPQEGVQIAIAFFTAVSVYLVPMIGWPGAKTAIAGVLAALGVLTTAIVGGVTTGDATGMILAVLTAVGVGAAPAVSQPSFNSAGGGLAEPVD